VLTQLGHDGLVVPAAGADEVLHRLAGAASEVGDRLRGLAFQFAEFALENHLGQLSLFLAVEAGQVALQEPFQAPATTAHVRGGNLSIGE
jgi:hypothetical protein